LEREGDSELNRQKKFLSLLDGFSKKITFYFYIDYFLPVFSRPLFHPHQSPTPTQMAMTTMPTVMNSRSRAAVELMADLEVRN
jgi:hypothetical protein